MSNEHKHLNDITSDDIKDAAIELVEQYGLHAQRIECRIEPIPPKPLEQEVGLGVARTATRNPITKWTVIIQQKNRGGRVKVEYSGLGGYVEATQFEGWIQ